MSAPTVVYYAYGKDTVIVVSILEMVANEMDTLHIHLCLISFPLGLYLPHKVVRTQITKTDAGKALHSRERPFANSKHAINASFRSLG